MVSRLGSARYANIRGWNRTEVSDKESELHRLQSQLAALEAKRDKMKSLLATSEPTPACLHAREQEQHEAVAQVEQQLDQERSEVHEFYFFFMCLTHVRV